MATIWTAILNALINWSAGAPPNSVEVSTANAGQLMGFPFPMTYSDETINLTWQTNSAPVTSWS